MEIREFKKVKRMENEDIIMPKRKTKLSAGYDFHAIEDVVIKPSKNNEVAFVKTGIKAKMNDDEVLLLFNRSSNPKKRGLILANGVGVIDADYYENEENDGEIAFAFLNISDKDAIIKKNDAIGQGVFIKYLKVVNDDSNDLRKGGFGSTGN